MPWIAFGDFNNALNPKNKKGGLYIPFSCLSGFKNCLLRCGLNECSLQGCKYTWRKSGMESNIDKVLVNKEFPQKFPNLTTVALPTILSNHTPIVIIFEDSKPRHKNIPFRYIGTWGNTEGYLQCLQEGLQTTTRGDFIYKFIAKLQKIRYSLKFYNSHIKKKLKQLNSYRIPTSKHLCKLIMIQKTPQCMKT